MRNDPTLVVRSARDSNLLLAHRGRDASCFGRDLRGNAYNHPLTELLPRFNVENRENILLLLSENYDYIHNLTPEQRIAYEAQRTRFFTQEQEKRIQLRRLFLGVRKDGTIAQNGIVPILYRAWQRYPDWNADQIIEVAKLRPRQRAFLEQNPLLLKAALQELRRIQDTEGLREDLHSIETRRNMFEISDQPPKQTIPSLESCIKFIEDSLPELFEKPLEKEPTYMLNNFLFANKTNIRNWMQIRNAIDWFNLYLEDLAKDASDQ